LLAFEEGQGLCFDRHDVKHVCYNLRSLPRHPAATAVWSEDEQVQSWSYPDSRMADSCCSSRHAELLVPFSAGRKTPACFSQVVRCGRGDCAGNSIPDRDIGSKHSDNPENPPTQTRRSEVVPK